MLRDEIAKVIYEGYTGLSWPDEDEHLNNAARKHADEIMELPEIKQVERMREKVKEAVNLMNKQCEASCGNKRNTTICDMCWFKDALTILKEADND